MMYMAIDWVAKAGPPPVSAVMMSYSLSTVISEMTTLIVVAGATMRSVTIRNCWKAFAPSIEQASYSSPGMFCSAARYTTVVKPVSTQETTTAADSCASCGVPSQLTGWLTAPAASRTWLTSPVGESIQLQTNPAMMPEITCGRNA